MAITCRLCNEELHQLADNNLDEFVYVSRDGLRIGRDSDVKHLFDPASNPVGASDPYDALNKMAELMGRAQSAKRVCLTPLYWTVAREYSALMVRLGAGMSFHIHRPDSTPRYFSEVPSHCGWPMWLRPSGWHCRECEVKLSEGDLRPAAAR